MQLGFTQSSRATNLRFADDVLLLASTLPQVTIMLSELQQNARPYGLEIHPDKTYILSNVSKRYGRQAENHVTINDATIQILPLEGGTLNTLVGGSHLAPTTNLRQKTE